ncbi:SDR family NAD(P)-dependent oxidoreductase [Polynucleobacter sp. AP-Ainpum-60-G11]|uniref:SDR family NAD(P)-dependent oxidoreductase n=1 Tax=Polynucleobacter sp. AP-Ainpum-60-G11 TaxID=2576926 RepID=UPI001BFE6956|nr:SDR family NAD(P)-dependent oxidoreductase [Polynucleobacter sp. AP-Ainpum-60-G11]QWE27004.1 SDR family NAD(P)-dependent oxidoreductase [Polynucleobacter sp. AP-Ainpum-60-G11]
MIEDEQLKKVFTKDSQRLFAKISGDANPIHLEELEAVKFGSKREVVHGANLFLTGLNWLISLNLNINTYNCIICDFKNTVAVDEEVIYRIENQFEKSLNLNVYTDATLCCTMKFSKTNENKPSSSGELLNSNIEENKNRENKSPNNNSRTIILNGNIWDANEEILRNQYTFIFDKYGKKFIKTILSMTYVVGMIVPGKRSLFLSFQLKLFNKDKSTFTYRISKIESRIKLYEIEFEAGHAVGTIRALRRRKSIKQPNIENVIKLTSGEEFKCANSLIIGGSRGIGELVAKIIAVKGGKTYITYYRDEAGANRVMNEINNIFPFSSQVKKLNVLDNDYGIVGDILKNIKHIYYFATPVINNKPNKVFDQKLFKNFIDHYFSSLFSLCLTCEKLNMGKIKIFYPSTIFLSEKNNHHYEYAAAKFVGEKTCELINKHFTNVSAHAVRIPILITDQVNSIFRHSSEKNLKPLIEIVKIMNN